MSKFTRASKKQAKLRMSLNGVSGTGKTFTSLSIGTNLGTRVAVIDTEKGSSSKYADKFTFDVLELSDFHPKQYVEAINAAEEEGYDVLIIDSLSHSWFGKNGALDLADQEAKRSKSGNTFQAWKFVSPIYNSMIERILQSNMHVFATMRTKTEYVVEKNDKGYSVPKKVGMQPIGRDNLEFEFDVVGDLDLDNNLVITKSRCSELSGKVFNKPGKDVAEILKGWLSDGAPISLFDVLKNDLNRVASKSDLDKVALNIKTNKEQLSSIQLEELQNLYKNIKV